MKVIRAPLRISLFGGGTDLPQYYEKYGSTIISFALSKSIYLIYNSRPTGGCRLSYSKVEEVSNLLEVEHTLVRAAERRFGVTSPCTLSIVSDVPKGTGLGSSSALAVALVCLTNGERLTPFSLAQKAYLLEREVSPVGFQDHLPASFGGFNTYKIGTDGKMTVHAISKHTKYLISTHGLLLYTGMDRQANDILTSMKTHTPWSELRKIHDMAEGVVQDIDELSPSKLGEALTETWMLKRRIRGVSSAKLDNQFSTALRAGAYGGKLCGAGGGGCWFFIVPYGSKKDVIDATGLVEIPFGIGERVSETVV